MKKILSLVLAVVSATTLALAATEKTVDCGNTATITATSQEGYHFTKWVNMTTNEEFTTNPLTITPAADVTYKAFFAINEYTITFTDAQGKVTMAGGDIYQHGATVTAPTAREKAATAEYSYEFKAWLNKTTGLEGVSAIATADAEYEAQYTAVRNKYTITFKNYNGDILQQSDWEYGTTPDYTGATPTKPSDGVNTYEFEGWDEAISTVTGEKTYTATFRISGTVTYTITVVSDNTDFGTVSGSGTFSANAEKTFTASAKECYRFVRWDDGNTEPTRTIIVTENKTYTAIFEKITYTVIVVSDDELKGSVKVE